MLSAGVVHGDLSDFNVLMAADGPVVIDFPQSVNAASNGNARKMLIRDVTPHSFVFDRELELLPGCKYSWCESKDDVSVQDIFRLQLG